MKKINKKVFLEDLPRRGKLISLVDWKKCIGCKVKFIYDDINGEIEIVDYKSKGNRLYIKYLDKEIWELMTTQFKVCGFGKLLGKKTTKFKIEIGKIFKDNKRDLIITDREHREHRIGKNNYNQKWYKYTCNKCSWTDGWMDEHCLLKGVGCPCCRGLIVVEGINDIPTTAPWMVKLFQGGHDEAKL